VIEFLLNKAGMFAQGLEDLGYTNVTTHVISIGNAIPIKQNLL
ncbi:2832_t:CDS:2, partial [Racocetra persica]